MLKINSEMGNFKPSQKLLLIGKNNRHELVEFISYEKSIFGYPAKVRFANGKEEVIDSGRLIEFYKTPTGIVTIPQSERE